MELRKSSLWKWKERSTNSPGFLVILGIAVVMLAAIILILCYFYLKAEECNTEVCAEVSENLLRTIDINIDPCEDFYGFICHGFRMDASNTLTASPLVRNTDSFQKSLNSLLLSPISESDSPLFVAQKRFIQACKDLQAIEEDSSITMLKFLDEIEGWPLLETGRNNISSETNRTRKEEWKEDRFDWVWAAMRARDAGITFSWFLNITYERDRRGLNKNKVQGKIPANVKDLDERQLEASLDAMVRIAVVLGGIEDDVKAELQEVLAFQNHLARITKERRASTIASQNQHFMESVSIWNNLVPGIIGHNKEFPDFKYHTGDVHLYMKDLVELLKNTNKRIQANFVGWKIVEEFAQFLPKSIRQEYKKLRWENEGIEEPGDRERESFCVKEARSRFEFVVEAEYLKTLSDVNQDTNTKINEMLDLLKPKIDDHFRNVHWLENSTHNITLHLEKIFKLRELSDLDEVHESLPLNKEFTLKSENVKDMIAQISKARYDAYYQQGKQHALKEERLKEYKKLVGNLTIYVDDNGIRIPAGKIFKSSVVFDPTSPSYLNFAGLGNELTTSVLEAIFRDIPYSLRQDLITENQCIVKEHKKFASDLRRPLDPESLASDYTTRLSPDLTYEACNEWVKQNGEELGLANLPYSPEQLYWIHSQYLKCFKDLNSLKIGEYSAKYAIDTVVKNSDHFAKAFDCPTGSAMNPQPKCQPF